jgi:hypothetical protein
LPPFFWWELSARLEGEGREPCRETEQQLEPFQATDYASATSSMSKFEILSQTGIAALAQANSVQQ